MSATMRTSSAEYTAPVGFPGLERRIARVRGVMRLTMRSLEVRAKPSSAVVVMGTTFTPTGVAKPL